MCQSLLQTLPALCMKNISQSPSAMPKCGQLSVLLDSRWAEDCLRSVWALHTDSCLCFIAGHSAGGEHERCGACDRVQPFTSGG